MKKFLAVLLIVLSLLLIAPAVHGQVSITPAVLSAACSSDGCILEWKVTIQNETDIPIKGNLVVTLTDENKNDVTSFSMGLLSFKGSEFKILEGTILMENSERTKSTRYLVATLVNIVPDIQIKTGPLLKF